MQAGSRNQENSHFNFRNERMTDRKTNQIDKNKFKFEQGNFEIVVQTRGRFI